MSKEDSNHKGEPVVDVTNSNEEPSTSGSGVIVDDDVKTTPQNLYQKIFDVANKMASTSLGQYAIEKVDSALSVVEKTAKWSLPQQLDSENENATADKGIPAPPLERPCSWLPFLTLIVALRVIRAGLSVGSILIGNEPVTPESLLYFVQTRRRKLRAIKYHGLRAIRMKHQNADERKKRGVVGKLSSIFGMVACRPGRRNSNTAIKYRSKKAKKNNSEKKNKSNKKNAYVNELPQKRPLEKSDESTGSDYDSEESDINEKLNKYANESSDVEDPDYVPPKDKSDDDETSGTHSESEEDDEISEFDKTNESSEIKEQENINTNNGADDEFETNGVEVKNEQYNLCNLSSSENFMENNPDSLTSSAINPVMMSSNIAASQNGTKYASPVSGNIENFYDPIEVEEIEGAFKGQDFMIKRTRVNSADDLFYSPIASPIANHLQQQNETDELKLSSSAEALHTVIKEENIENLDDSNDASDNNEKHNQNNNQKFHKSLKHNNNNNTNTNNNRQSHYKYTKGKKLH